jgi:hypothetical protein
MVCDAHDRVLDHALAFQLARIPKIIILLVILKKFNRTHCSTFLNTLRKDRRSGFCIDGKSEHLLSKSAILLYESVDLITDGGG